MYLSLRSSFAVLLAALATAGFVSAAPGAVRAAGMIPREGRCHETFPGSGIYIC